MLLLIFISDLCPHWLFVGTPSVIRPELASRRAEHSLTYSDVIIYIFDIFIYLCWMCIGFYDLSAWCGCCFVVFIMSFIQKYLNACPFDNTAVFGGGKVGPVNRLTKPVGCLYVTPTERTNSVRNRIWHICWYKGFCHRTESDLFFFLFRFIVVILSMITLSHYSLNKHCLLQSLFLVLILKLWNFKFQYFF